MHEIEPFWKWRDRYKAQFDKRSPFYGTESCEFEYTRQVYNYYIHPQWDEFGSDTLYLKVIYADYEQQFAVIEFIGEWNDAIGNDIMFLKREVIDAMLAEGICKFILIGENILNFHALDNDYYAEWCEEVECEGGWIIAVNFGEHIVEEMQSSDLHYYIHLHERFSEVPWRNYHPNHLEKLLDAMLLKKLS